MSEQRRDFKIKEEALSSFIYFYTMPMKKKPIVAEVYHRDKIDRDILQRALDLSLKRMPYMADTMVEKKGRFYYAEDPLPFEVAVTDKIRRIGGTETNYHLIDITCHDNVTNIAAAHEFCDGQGMQFLLESVLYNYYCIRDGVEYEPGHIRTGRTAMSEEETKEPYKVLPRNRFGYRLDMNFLNRTSEEETGISPQDVKKKGIYRLPEFGYEDYDTIHFKALFLPSDDFMALVKECKSSPAVVLSLMMGDAVLRVHPDADKIIRTEVPLSARRFLGCPETFKNSSSKADLPVGGTAIDDKPFAYRAEVLRKILLQQLDPEAVRADHRYELDAIDKLIRLRLGYRRLTKLLERFRTNAFDDTFYLDYIGTLRAPGFADKIECFNQIVRPVLGCPMHINVHEFNGRFHISFITKDDVPCYVDAFKSIMEEHGLSVQEEKPRQVMLPDTEWDYGMKS